VRIVERALLQAPADRVWRTLVDFERQASWMPDVAWIRRLGVERELGARFAVRTRVLGIPAATDLITVTAWEPERRLAVEHTGMVKGRGEWRLRASPDRRATAFEWREQIRLSPPVVGDLALFLYRPVHRWMLHRSIRNLRRLVERS
jgi:carbon monoxide dehydrogenase subunit G